MATSKEMTAGPALPLIFNFTLPLLFGNLLQQTYSLVDAAIVGKFLGINALASVGASTSVVFLILGFCNGCCGGFGIPVAQKFGARDYSTTVSYTHLDVYKRQPLGRAMFREGMSGLLVQTLTHCDVIINLAGAPINQRWTPEHKQELFNSRITVTHRIIRALNAVKTKPKLMISASAVGYYPSLVESDEYTQTRGDGCLLYTSR